MRAGKAGRKTGAATDLGPRPRPKFSEPTRAVEKLPARVPGSAPSPRALTPICYLTTRGRQQCSFRRPLSNAASGRGGQTNEQASFRSSSAPRRPRHRTTPATPQRPASDLANRPKYRSPHALGMSAIQTRIGPRASHAESPAAQEAMCARVRAQKIGEMTTKWGAWTRHTHRLAAAQPRRVASFI